MVFATISRDSIRSVSFSFQYIKNIKREKRKRFMKTISKQEMEKLVKNKIIHNTARGLVDKYGNPTGFYRTKTRRYIEDKYADMAKKL